MKVDLGVCCGFLPANGNEQGQEELSVVVVVVVVVGGGGKICSFVRN